MGTLKLQDNEQQYGGTLVVDGWAITFGIAARGLGGLRLRPFSSCTKCNSPPINGQCINFILFHVALLLHLYSKGLKPLAHCNLRFSLLPPFPSHSFALLLFCLTKDGERCFAWGRSPGHKRFWSIFD